MTNPSSYQTAFFTALTSSNSSLLLNAVAGSGKTTTIVHGTSLLPRTISILFLAFNKRIADELAKRVPSHVQTATFHSRGLSALKRSLPKPPKVDANKVFDLFKSLNQSKKISYSDFQTYHPAVTKLVSLAKSSGLGTSLLDPSYQSWEFLADHFGVYLKSGDLSVAIDFAQRVLELSNENLSPIDFDDMLYLPLLLNSRFDKSNIIFIDEAQDTNSVQRALLPKMLAEGGRLIAVGDPHQAIYGFRGADANAMSQLQTEFSMIPMDLSICYRCSTSIISEAQKYLN